MTNNKRKIDSRSPQQGESPDSKIYKQSEGNSPQIQYAKRQGLSPTKTKSSVSLNDKGKQMFPPSETLIITSRAKKFLLLTLNSLHYLIITMIGSVNDQAIEIKPLKNSVLVYAPSETIRRKILGLTKLVEAAATKEINENKVTKNRVYKVIPKPVDTEILNIKKQETMLRQTGVDIKIVKQLGKAGYLLVTLSDKDSKLKSIPLTSQGQNLEYDLPPYKPNPKFCTKCASLGHYAKQCRKSINTCIKCAGKHATKNCNGKNLKCNNCGGKHQAIDKSCPKYIFQKQVLENVYSYKMSFDQAKQKAKQKGEPIPKIINSPVSEDETIPKIISTSNVTPGKSYADSVKSKVINNDTDIISDNEANMSPVDNPEINIDQNLNIETENTQIEDQTPSIPNKDRKNISDIRKTIIKPPSKDVTNLKNWETLITEIRNIADYQVLITEVVGVSVNCQNNKINIVKVYRSPNQDIKFNDYQEVLPNLSDNIVLLGDFKSRSSMWGSSTTDSNGNIIEKVIDQNNMIILNDGTGTFQTVTGNRTQIDLTLVSASLANDSQWSVLDDQLGSDHFPVLTVLNAKPVKNKVCTPQRWIYDKADWHRFTTLCNEINIDNIKHDDIEIFNQHFCEVVTKIADETIPKTSGTVHTRKNCPWWNDDCTNAKKKKIISVINIEYMINQNQKKIMNYIKLQSRSLNVSLIRQKLTTGNISVTN
ncbi:unnamed protein product [Mytilus coruscus]|uniref:CCHC-type domain-containing protein n=1 Tax=Mytilus coruscus TaxID=42192 RepID=A0A6J8A7J9_MYTCO|nr:unnamed protein product [Mytilus coruscus]